MGEWIIWLALCLLLAFLGYARVVILEQRRGVRFGVTRLRSIFDVWFALVEEWCSRQVRHFVRYVLQLHWHYGVHALYRFSLLTLQGIYHRLESRFEANRRYAKQLRAEQRREIKPGGQLQTIVEHKTVNALSPAQKRALKRKSVERF